MRTPAAWLRSCKRRKPGIYAYRTRMHLQPWRTEWGYVGKSRHLDLRNQCHEGTCGRHQNCIEKPWMDLRTQRFGLRLPWWLGWDWITLPLETLAILAVGGTRYNWQKNPRRDKVGPREQKIQRAIRDSMPTTYRAKIRMIRLTDIVIRVTAVLLIIAGIGGYLWARM